MICAGLASVVRSKSNVGHGTVAGDEQVADRSADEVQAVPGGGEPFGERGQLGQNGPEAVRNHGARGYWRLRTRRRECSRRRPTVAWRRRSGPEDHRRKTAGGGGGSWLDLKSISEERRTLHRGEVGTPFTAAATVSVHRTRVPRAVPGRYAASTGSAGSSPADQAVVGVVGSAATRLDDLHRATGDAGSAGAAGCRGRRLRRRGLTEP